jgi:hypothetical protein
LAIELKAKGQPTSEQRTWQETLQAKGYKALIMPSNLDLIQGLNWLKEEVIEYMSGKMHI